MWQSVIHKNKYLKNNNDFTVCKILFSLCTWRQTASLNERKSAWQEQNLLLVTVVAKKQQHFLALKDFQDSIQPYPSLDTNYTATTQRIGQDDVLNLSLFLKISSTWALLIKLLDHGNYDMSRMVPPGLETCDISITGQTFKPINFNA